MHARLIPLTVIAASLLVLAAARVSAAPPANEHFQRTWARTDQPVANGQVSRTWMWGPEANTGARKESYSDTPGGEREVQYYDKSRMEINDPGTDPNTPFFVTNGLLVVELMTGRLQLGDDDFEQYLPARVNVAGDADDPSGVTYAVLATLRGAAPAQDGAVITERLDAAGIVTNDQSLASYGALAAYRVTVPGIDHQVASPFWALMNAAGLVFVDGSYTVEPLFENPFYATGYPVTEAYWTTVLVGGTPHLVLLQCFERRCLTFTPGNPPGWEVEAGNVGQHYYHWRYVDIPAEGTPTQTGTITTTAVATPTGTATASATISPTSDTATEYESRATWGGSWDPDTALMWPADIAVDENGVVYVVDSGNARIQKYDARGLYLGAWGEAGDGDGQFDTPIGIAVYQDVVYVTDAERDLVQTFTPDGEFLAAWGASGAGEGEFSRPGGVAANSNGVYVVDTGNGRVEGFTVNGIYQGQTAPGALTHPSDIALDSLGAFYVTDGATHRVSKFSPFGALLDFWGEEGDGHGQFDMPFGIAIGADDIVYVVDSENNRVETFTTNGDYLGEWMDVGIEYSLLSGPRTIAVGGEFVYVTDLSGLVLRYRTSGYYVEAWPDNRIGRFDRPLGLDIRPDGLVYYIADSGLDRIQMYGEPAGSYLGGWGITGDGSGEGELSRPVDVAVAADGRIFVVDSGNDRIVAYSEGHEELYFWGGHGDGGGSFDAPTAIAIAEDGTIFVADNGNSRVQAFDSDGNYLFRWGELGATSGAFDFASGIAVSGDMVYVVDSNNNRVQAFDLDGHYRFQWGEFGSEPGQFNGPIAVSADTDGFLYVTDEHNNRIEKFTPDGSFVAEWGEFGSTPGQLNFPFGIAIHANGDVYVTEVGLDRVQVFSPVE